MKSFKSMLEDTYSADYKVDAAGRKHKARRIAFDFGDAADKEKKKEKDAEKGKVDEKLDLKKADMGDVIKDFQDSDAPQFKGKSMEKRRQMAIAAKMQAKNEELKGNQHKLDKNKNGKLDADDFKKLRKEGDEPPFTPDPPKNKKPQRNSDGSVTSPMSKARQLAKQAIKNAEKTVAQHKEGVEFDDEGNLLEAKNKITFHNFMGATKKKQEKKGGDNNDAIDQV